jgi:PAS domain S-box-containing protein
VARNSGRRAGVAAKFQDRTERNRLEEESRKAEERLKAELDAITRLHKLATLSMSEAGLEPLLGEIVDVAIAVSGSDFGTIQLLDPVSLDLRIVAHRGFPRWWLDFWQSVSRGQGSCGTALECGERVIVEDVERSPIFAGTPALDVQLKAGVRAVQSTPLVSRSGKPLGMFSTHYKKPHRPDARTLRLLDLLARHAADVIEHEQVTIALGESEQRYRWLAEQVVDGIFVADSQGRYVDANRAGCEMLGYTREELLTLSIPDLLAPDELPRLPAQYELLATGQTVQNEWRFKRKDGSLFLGELTGRQLPDGRFQGVVRDVTERKQAQAEAQAIMDTAPVAMFIARDPKCREIIGNRMAYELLRVPPGSNLSKSAAEGSRPDSFRVIKDGIEIPPHQLPIQNAAATGQAIYNCELEVRYQDGGNRSVIGNAVPLLLGDGSTRGAIGTFLDITDLKRAEEKLAQETRRKDEFLALLGHELRNPLAAIANAMQVVSGGVTAVQRASLDELIVRQVDLLRRLVDDLLDLSRITHGQISLQKERVDLAPFLRRVTEAAQSTSAHRGQEVVLRLPSEPIAFMADKARLHQIAANLLDNASKYTDWGGRIEFSGRREGSEVVIRCKDNGRGIPLEMQKEIFEPFTRMEMAGQSAEPGLGIGLAMVKRMVELHGGTVLVQSEGAGRGSEFVVRLPVVPVPSDQPTAFEAKPAPRSRHALAIALVEDNPDVAQTLVIALEQAGHRVRLFTDGSSALAGLSRPRPDAVVLDIGLPGMDGYELAAKLRKKRNFQHALFIAISGFKRRTQAGKPGDGFDHYIIKPVDLPALLSLLETRARAGARKAAKRPKPLRVLLVEDNADLAASMAELLRREGLEVRTAFSGREALEAAPDFHPQLVLCDLHLRDMKGQEVVRGLRSIPATQGTHAVILTALSDAQIRAYNSEARKIGVDQFISKPLTPDAIRGLLAKLRPS